MCVHISFEFYNARIYFCIILVGILKSHSYPRTQGIDNTAINNKGEFKKYIYFYHYQLRDIYTELCGRRKRET